MKTLYENVVKLCQERGICVHGLEKELGFGKSTIRNWRKTSPRIDSVKKVAAYFEASLDALVGDEVSVRCDGKVTVFTEGEAVCGCAFSSVAKIVDLVKLFAQGDYVEVDVQIRRGTTEAERGDGGGGQLFSQSTTSRDSPKEAHPSN